MAKPLSILAAAGLVSLLLLACDGVVRYTRPVVEAEGRYVKLDARYGYGQEVGYDGSSMTFAHPISLQEAEWTRLLQQVQIQPLKSILSIGNENPGPREAFTDSEQRYLARYLAQAFAIARPDEWVVFYLVHPRKEGRDSGVTEATSGGLFIREQQLYLVLANYRYGVTTESVLNQIRGDPLRPASDHRYEFVPGAHQKTQRVKLWNLTQPLRAYQLELMLDYPTMLTSPIGREGPSPSIPSLEERLRQLQQLYEKGLVTEEEYRHIRQNLLDEL